MLLYRNHDLRFCQLQVVGNYKQKILEKSQVYFKDNRVVVKREDMASARIINVFR